MTQNKHLPSIPPEKQIMEAKVRLRMAAGTLSLPSVYRKHPKTVLGLAFSAGIILGMYRRSSRKRGGFLENAGRVIKQLGHAKVMQQILQLQRGTRS
jgi:hypothetical protein